MPSTRKKKSASLNLSKARAIRIGALQSEASGGPLPQSNSQLIPMPDNAVLYDLTSSQKLKLKVDIEQPESSNSYDLTSSQKLKLKLDIEQPESSNSLPSDEKLNSKPKGKPGRKPGYRPKAKCMGLDLMLQQEDPESKEMNGKNNTLNSLNQLSPLTPKRRSFYREKSLYDQTCGDESGGVGKPYLLIGKKALSQLLSRCICEICGELLEHSHSNVIGWVDEVTLRCYTCANSDDTLTSEKFIDVENSKDIFYDSLLRVIYSTLLSGNGYKALCDLLLCLEFPTVSELLYARYANHITDKIQTFCKKTLDEAGNEIRETHLALGNEAVDKALNISVKLDGAWTTKGHDSNYGFIMVMEAITGLILDYVIFSKYCSQCSNKKTQLSEDQFETWHHKEHKDCLVNYDSSSGSMEEVGAKLLWNRSLERGFRYVGFLGNRESLKAVSWENPYGDKWKVVEEDFFDYVCKKMTAAIKKTIGKFINETQIQKLLFYYKESIRNNFNSVEKAQKEIEASLNHSMSTDKHPNHEHCPASWCFYQQALARNEPPGSHEDELNVPVILSKENVQNLKGIYNIFTNCELIKRCQGISHNFSELIKNKIWRKCPKGTCYGKPRLEFAVSSSLIEYNKGYEEGYLLALLEPREENSQLVKRKRSTKREMRPRKTSGRCSYVEDYNDDDDEY